MKHRESSYERKHEKREMHERRERKEEHHGKMDINDNRKVTDNHQGGIERVLMRKGDLVKGKGGKMHNEGESNFDRSGASLTPRKA
jgi:hypothetical protein